MDHGLRESQVIQHRESCGSFHRGPLEQVLPGENAVRRSIPDAGEADSNSRASDLVCAVSGGSAQFSAYGHEAGREDVCAKGPITIRRAAQPASRTQPTAGGLPTNNPPPPDGPPPPPPPPPPPRPP